MRGLNLMRDRTMGIQQNQRKGMLAPHGSDKTSSRSGDGAPDLLDIFCVLDGFQGTFSEACTPCNADLAPCPAGDNTIDLFDILASLDAFCGADNCGCVQGGMLH